MSKHLIVRANTPINKLNAPEVFVLPLTIALIIEIQNKIAIANSVRRMDPLIESLAFNYGLGHWMHIDNPEWVDNAVGENDYDVHDLEDVMMIVGNEVTTPMLHIQPSGKIHFECFDLDSETDLYTEDVEFIDLEKAMGL